MPPHQTAPAMYKSMLSIFSLMVVFSLNAGCAGDGSHIVEEPAVSEIGNGVEEIEVPRVPGEETLAQELGIQQPIAPGLILGYVHDSDGRPLPMISLELVDENGLEVYGAVTGYTGDYHFRGVREGQYTVVAIYSRNHDRPPFIRHGVDVTLAEGDTVRVDLVLEY